MESVCSPISMEIQELSSKEEEIPGTSSGNKGTLGKVNDDAKRRRSTQGTRNSWTRRRTKANISKKSDDNLDDEIFFVDKILEKCVENDGEIKYLIKWEGYSSNFNTWEPKDNISPSLIAAFEKAKAKDKQSKHILPKLRFKLQPPSEDNIDNINEEHTLTCKNEDFPGPDNDKINIEYSGIRYSEENPNLKISTIDETVSARSILNEVETGTLEIATINDVENISTEVMIEDRIDEQEQNQILSKTEATPDNKNVELQYPLVKFESDGFRILSTETNLNGKTLKQIMSATSYRGETIFLVDFEEASDYVLVKSSYLNVAFPQQVIKYYEDRIAWSDQDDEEDNI